MAFAQQSKEAERETVGASSKSKLEGETRTGEGKQELIAVLLGVTACVLLRCDMIASLRVCT